MNNSALTYYANEGYMIVRPEAIYGRSSHIASGEAISENGYRAANVVDVYGSSSELVDMGAEELFVPALSHEPLFHILLFATVVMYIYMLYRSWGFVVNIYRDLFVMRSERNMIYQGGFMPLQHFKHVASSIGFILMALVTLRFVDSFVPESSPIYEAQIASLAPVGAIFIVVVYVAWYFALHKIIEWVTLSDAAPGLSAMGYMHFVRMTVVLYPLVVVWLLGSNRGETVIVPLLIIVAVVMLILYLKDTILFFIDKKISILYWILYLCTAFLLPLSFVMHLLPQRLG